MRSLTLGQSVDSHAELPEVGMFHRLVGRNSRLGLVLRRQSTGSINHLVFETPQLQNYVSGASPPTAVDNQ